MKRIFLLIFFGFLIPISSESQTITVLTTTNGIAPIPAFTLGEPAALLILDTKLSKHLSLTPDIAFSLKNGNLWFSDIWLRYTFNPDTAKKWAFIVGLDSPSFVGESTTNEVGKEIKRAANYSTAQLCVKRNVGKYNSIILDYWYLWAFDMTTGIKGNYISLSFNFMKPFEKFSLMSNPNIFHLNYSDGTKGFVGAIDFKLTHNKSGLFLASQGTTPISAKTVKSSWNISIGFSRKMF